MSSRNPFALLADDGGSDVESSPLPKQTKPIQVDAAPPAKGPAKSGSINNATTRRNIPGQTTVRPQKEAKELPASDAPAGSQGQFEGERGRDDRGTGFGRGRGRGAARGERGADRGRGGRGGRGGRSERPDRRSATGITDSAKQEHQSWGGDDGKRELENETAGVSDANAEKTEAGAATPTTDAPAAATTETAAGTEAAATTPAAPVEEEDNSKTYEEYLKERQAAGKSFAPLEGRKANEGQDESQWKDGVAITKPSKDEENFYVGQQKERAAKAAKEPKAKKQLLEVEFQAPRIDRGQRTERGGARGSGRGRGEGGRGRGEGRGRGAPRGGAASRGGRTNGSSNGAAINPDDNTAFPSLS